MRGRGIHVCERTVEHALHRYEELVAVHLHQKERLQKLFERQGRVVLAFDGLQPDVGHEVLWVLREAISGEILIARALLSSSHQELAALLHEAKAFLPENVEICGIVSDGQQAIRLAVATVFSQRAHQLCHFHYFREAAKPIYEADRHAKKELKKRVRGIRPIEQILQGKSDQESEVVRDYCLAVRSALTDDGHPPLAASGLTLYERLKRISASISRVAEKRGDFPNLFSASSIFSKKRWRTPGQIGRRLSRSMDGFINSLMSSETMRWEQQSANSAS